MWSGAARLVDEPQERAVHEPEVMEVAPGHHQLVADLQPSAADGSTVGVELVSERGIERVYPELAAVHRCEHLDVAHRIDAVVGSEAIADERDDLIERGLSAWPLE